MINELHNILLNTDSYKPSQYLQLPENTERVFSYIASRGGDFEESVNLGFQIFAKDWLTTPITMDHVLQAKEIWKMHGEPFNAEGFKYIVDEHGGFLPVEIKMVPEGSVIPVKNVLLTCENTDPKCAWLTQYLETALLRAIWYPTTIATHSREIKKTIKHYLELTGDPENVESQLMFKLHDFGARGVSSFESAGIGGLAHLVNFSGSDTMTGVLYARKYYGKEMAGFSIPASEHSSMTALGKEGQVAQFSRMIDKFGKPGAIYACVSDGYDIFDACENIWGETLRQKVIDAGAKLVIRPDSGDPETTILRCLRILAHKFGTHDNSKGYRVINHVGLIQGDGVDAQAVRAILANLEINGFSAENIAFGMGGALLQGKNRDTMKFAMKCSWMQIDGQGRDVFKDPVTDPGKTSMKGRLTLVKNTKTNAYKTIRLDHGIPDGHVEVLEPVFRNGKLLKEFNFDEVRQNASL